MNRGGYHRSPDDFQAVFVVFNFKMPDALDTVEVFRTYGRRVANGYSNSEKEWDDGQCYFQMVS